MLQFIKRYLAILIIAAVYVWSMLAIAITRTSEEPGDAIVLRIGHWQLEASVREALNQMAEEYSAMRVAKGLTPVKIIQDAIPEMTYAQFATTQLMGGTAPDIMEVGAMLPYHLWVQYYNRYFVPISRYVDMPNPYNEGTDAADIPFRMTYKDGMRNSYIEELQEYMSVPLSQFGTRIFYNKDLLYKLTGQEICPTNYRGFLEVCDEIEKHSDRTGQPYIAIAGSKYHLGMWEGPMFDPTTYAIVRVADFNRDGFVANDELYIAFKTDRISFEYPAIKARFKMLREVTDHFQTGYTGLSRDEAVFLFAQQRAVFMTTGTWDARSLQEQAKGVFTVGVMDFPLPSRDDEYYGDIIEGPSYERLMGGFPFAITRTSKHPEVALDFLLYLAAQKNNEKLNKIIGWIPAIRGAEVDPLLKAFEPHLEGVYGNLNLFLGGETWIRWLQLYTLYQVNQISYEDMAAEFEPFYEDYGLKDLMEQQKDWRRGMQNNEQYLAGVRAKALYDDSEKAESDWIKYRVLSASRQIWPEINRTRQMNMLKEGPALDAVGPYEYSDEVLNKIRERIKQESDNRHSES